MLGTFGARSVRRPPPHHLTPSSGRVDGVSAAPPRRRRRVFPRRSQHRRREIKSTNSSRRQQPRRVGLLDSFQLLGAGVARAEDGRARRGLRRERRLVHAARVGLGRGAERARDAERGGCFCRLCCCCCSITWLGLHAASMAYSRSDPFSLTSLHRAEARRWCTGGYRRRTPPHQYKTSSTRISTPPVRQRRTSARNERVSLSPTASRRYIHLDAIEATPSSSR